MGALGGPLIFYAATAKDEYYKPAPGMFKLAARDLKDQFGGRQVDLARSFFVDVGVYRGVVEDASGLFRPPPMLRPPPEPRLRPRPKLRPPPPPRFLPKLEPRFLPKLLFAVVVSTFSLRYISGALFDRPGGKNKLLDVLNLHR